MSSTSPSSIWPARGHVWPLRAWQGHTSGKTSPGERDSSAFDVGYWIMGREDCYCTQRPGGRGGGDHCHWKVLILRLLCTLVLRFSLWQFCEIISCWAACGKSNVSPPISVFSLVTIRLLGAWGCSELQIGTCFPPEKKVWNSDNGPIRKLPRSGGWRCSSVPGHPSAASASRLSLFPLLPSKAWGVLVSPIPMYLVSSHSAQSHKAVAWWGGHVVQSPLLLQSSHASGGSGGRALTMYSALSSTILSMLTVRGCNKLGTGQISV